MAKKVSVVIPNYNGKELLEKNLPTVVKTCKVCELIVVDDASTDGSAKFLRDNFKHIKVIEQKQNKGFASTANLGAKHSQGDLILFLNSDVSPREGFLQKALAHFKNDNTFAVGLADVSHEGAKTVIRGKGGAKFKKGFLLHFAVDPQRGESLWVSGGSSLIDRKKFNEIGGFDTIFAPFYWEDIDLCYRARKRGYICLFEPEAKVDHYHDEGAIKKHFSASKIKTSSYKNQFIFVWKNISDPYLIIQHLLWLPFHVAQAVLTFDKQFLAGFFWAILQVPAIILSSEPSFAKLSDKEVLKGFEN
jgi:GT2 family glycosyltransferase